MRIRNACVFIDSFNPPDVGLVRALMLSASNCGISLTACRRCSGILPELPAQTEACDAAIVLGGDGTILRGLDEFMGTRVPVAGINTGHLGFLASAEAPELDSALRRLSNGEFTVERLPVLKADLPGGKQISAVNDICLNRALTVGMLHVELGTPSEVIARMAGDGIVVSTALGSTAYALSAGGPILDPALPAMLVVPICAHQLSLRPIVFSSSTCLRLSVTQARGDSPLVVADGVPVAEIRQGEQLTVTSGPGDCSLVRFSPGGFYARLGQKLGWSSRG